MFPFEFLWFYTHPTRQRKESVKTIINWLRTMEMLASNVYLEAAEQLTQDQEFSAFLFRMSDEEAWHFHIIGSAMTFLEEAKEVPQAAVTIDPDMKNELELPFKELYEAITNKTITRKDVVDCIVKTEFTEWNSIFVYVINALQKQTSMFQHVAATIESHKEKTIKFLKNLPEDLKVSDDVWRFPDIWDKKILIVEDETAIRELLSDVLKGMGHIETAANGQEGLDKTSKDFFNVVVSDIGMPVMNGMEFYLKAVEENPHFNRQFLFCTGDITPDVKKFLHERNLPHLEKPFSLKLLNRTVQEMMDKTL
jgi:CheY-like chemotaxis protein